MTREREQVSKCETIQRKGWKRYKILYFDRRTIRECLCYTLILWYAYRVYSIGYACSYWIWGQLRARKHVPRVETMTYICWLKRGEWVSNNANARKRCVLNKKSGLRAYSCKFYFKSLQVVSSNVTHPFDENPWTILLPLNLNIVCARNKMLSLYFIDVLTSS